MKHIHRDEEARNCTFLVERRPPPVLVWLRAQPGAGESKDEKVTSLAGGPVLASVLLGFPCGSAGRESTYNEGDLGSIPGLGRSPGEGKGYPFQFSGLENSMDYPWGHKESDMTEQLSLNMVMKDAESTNYFTLKEWQFQKSLAFWRLI